MPVETSKTIREWGDDLFGAPQDLTVLVARARVEIDELEQSLREGNPEEAGREAAHEARAELEARLAETKAAYAAGEKVARSTRTRSTATRGVRDDLSV